MNSRAIQKRITELNSLVLNGLIDDTTFRREVRAMLVSKDWQARIQYENMAVLPL